jgi:hypothetical protein
MHAWMRPWYAALDRHVPSCPCHQHGLHQPASPSLVQQRPSRTLILKQVLSELHARRFPEADRPKSLSRSL